MLKIPPSLPLKREEHSLQSSTCVSPPFTEAFSIEIYNNTQQFTLQKSTQKPILFTVYKR